MSEFESGNSAQENAVVAIKPRFNIQPLVFAFVLLVTVFFTYQIVGGVITYLLFGLSVTEGNITGMRVATIMAQFLFLLGPSLLAIRFLNADWKFVLRLNPIRLKETGLVFVTVIALQVLLQAYLRLQETVLRAVLPESIITLMEKLEELIEGIYLSLLGMHTPYEFVFVLLVAAVTPAICEELLFRGVVQHAFERGVRIRYAIFLNGLIFGLFHLNPLSLVPLVVIGGYLSFIVWRSNSIYLGIIAHFINNSMAVISLYVVGSENADVADVTAGLGIPETIMVSVVAALFVGLFIVLFWRATNQIKRS